MESFAFIALVDVAPLWLMRLATVESQDSPERNRDPTQCSTTTDATPIRGLVRLTDYTSGRGKNGTSRAPAAYGGGEDDSADDGSCEEANFAGGLR